MIAIYITALVMGLTGSLHCAGMCGPIMLFMPFMQFKGLKRIAGIALYHFSRITAYALMALVLFSFRSIFNPQVQQAISVVLGSILIISGILSFLPVRAGWRLNLPWAEAVKKHLAYFMSAPGLTAISISGFLNGLLPCGLVYLALSATLSLQSSAQAVLFTYFFGLGTLPALIGIILFGNRIPALKRISLSKFAPVVAVFFGCILMLRGLNLGIPYLSPKPELSKGGVHASCCHK